MKKQVLAAIREESKRNAVISLCKDMSAEYIAISEKDLNKFLGEILGFPLLKPMDHPLINDKKPAPPMFTLPDVMIFNGFDGTSLERFLDEYNNAKIEPTVLKGTVTPTNLAWTLYEVIKEYEEEASAK